MNIGSVKVNSAVVLAPMAGNTSHPFRLLAKEQGAGLVYSEMISARGLVQDRNNRYYPLMYYTDGERPIVFQLFGSEPLIMAEAARKLESIGADVIDLNFSCPAPKVLCRGQGGALMRDLSQCGRIMEMIVESVSCPVTIKIRKGWDDSLVNALVLAMLAVETGIKAITVHGRTVQQGFSGRADWDIVGEIKQSAPPGFTIIGNGDISSPADADFRLRQTGCDGVMIGRAALGNPWLFKQVNCRLKAGGKTFSGPTTVDIKETVIRHLDLLCDLKGERAAVLEMRSQAAYYVKGRRGVSRFRRRLMTAANRSQMMEVIRDYFDEKNIIARNSGEVE